jgi:ArsR family transcriptional regulator
MQEEGQAVLLDVRGAGQAERAKLPGAVNIPLAELHRRRDELPQDKLIIVYAYTRIPAEVEAAKMAAALLSQDGTRRAAVLKGSSQDWLAAGFPVELPQGDKKGTDAK